MRQNNDDYGRPLLSEVGSNSLLLLQCPVELPDGSLGKLIPDTSIGGSK